MKHEHLNMLRMDVPVPDNCFYHDDGEVKNIYAHMAGLYKRYGPMRSRLPLPFRVLAQEPIHLAYSFLRNLKLPLGLKTGACITYVVEIRDEVEKKSLPRLHTHAFTAYSNSLDDKVFKMGHEETHYLIESGNLDLLKDGFKSIGIDGETLDKLPEEALCYAGGFYSLKINLPSHKYRLAKYVKDDPFYDWLKENANWVLK